MVLATRIILLIGSYSNLNIFALFNRLFHSWYFVKDIN